MTHSESFSRGSLRQTHNNLKAVMMTNKETKKLALIKLYHSGYECDTQELNRRNSCVPPECWNCQSLLFFFMISFLSFARFCQSKETFIAPTHDEIQHQLTSVSKTDPEGMDRMATLSVRVVCCHLRCSNSVVNVLKFETACRSLSIVTFIIPWIFFSISCEG